MSNIAGKAYAMNVITPIRWYTAWVNKLVCKIVAKHSDGLKGLATLSLIHYARWVIIDRNAFPHLDRSQPKEDLQYAYMMFFSNFNGSWNQYVDSFTFAIPGGLDLFWKFNVRYPHSVPLTPFHKYIQYNQVETSHYYSAYPLAASNDVKSAARVKQALIAFDAQSAAASSEQFALEYRALLRYLQADLGDMHPTPIVSMSAQAVEHRLARDRSKARAALANAALPQTAIKVEEPVS
jgi:hypothetical protein